MSVEPPKLRLFVAVEMPERIRADVDAAVSALQREAPEAKWTSPAQWHLTLAFLGWVDPARVPDVERACGSAVTGLHPFEVHLDGSAGTFGNRVLWAELERSEPLELLALRLREELAAAGFEIEDRPFRAHLTLARAPRGGRLPRGLAVAYRGPAQRWTVKRLVLMRSRLARSGARYSVESAWPFGGVSTDPSIS